MQCGFSSQKGHQSGLLLFQYKDHFSRYGISMRKVRRLRNCLIFMMGIPKLVRWSLYIEMPPGRPGHFPHRFACEAFVSCFRHWVSEVFTSGDVSLSNIVIFLGCKSFETSNLVMDELMWYKVFIVKIQMCTCDAGMVVSYRMLTNISIEHFLNTTERDLFHSMRCSPRLNLNNTQMENDFSMQISLHNFICVLYATTYVRI